MSTTKTAIREALETTIKGLTTGGKPFKRDKYVKAPPGHNWDEPSEQWIDRTFSIGVIEEGEPLYYGTVSDVMYEGEFTLTIGHLKSYKKQDGLDRMDTDIGQLREQLEKESNRPTSVWLIRYVGSSITEYDDYWVTDLKFRTNHTRALV